VTTVGETTLNQSSESGGGGDSAVESLSFKLRRWCPVDVGVEVNLFLFEFNCTIVDYKPTATKELSPSTGLDLEAKSCI
jgi:hypothetical protein